MLLGIFHIEVKFFRYQNTKFHNNIDTVTKLDLSFIHFTFFPFYRLFGKKQKYRKIRAAQKSCR